MRFFALCVISSLMFVSSASAQLLIPDSGAGDRIMMFSDVDGSLIDANWLSDTGAVGWFFTTPKEAMQVGNEIWISDQVADAIHRFDFNRNFLGSITAHPNGGVIDNLRGMGIHNGQVYLTVFHSTTAMRGVAAYNFDGTTSHFFQATTASNSLFDADSFNGNVMISNNTTGALQLYSSTGAFNGNFATGVTAVQQISVLGDNSVLATSSIASAGVEGVYHFNPDGSLRLFIDTELLKMQVGELVPRGAFLLGDGNYLIATSDGVFKYLTASNTFSTVLAGVDAQYINYIPIPAPGALALLATGMFISRRRRS
jgi:hypothetical protein